MIWTQGFLAVRSAFMDLRGLLQARRTRRHRGQQALVHPDGATRSAGTDKKAWRGAPSRRPATPGCTRLKTIRRALGTFLLAAACSIAHAECPSGEDQCRPGFVWRGAFPGDHVCVSGASRARAAQDNGQAPSRTVPGSDACRAGFVWRDAEPGDKVCTTGTVRSESATENQLAAQRRDPSCAVPKTANSLGVLALNVAGIGGTPGSVAPVAWETRAQRIALSLKRNRLSPDVITLTELHAWLYTPPLRDCGRGFARGAGDYDQIDILLKELRTALGIAYRVAYTTGDVESWGVIRCQAFFGQAMLYNPDRLLHLSLPGAGAPMLPHVGRSGLVGIPHVRRSLPLCSRGTSLTPLPTLIDGPMHVEKCAAATPSGPAHTVFGSEAGHVSASHSRFAFRTDPSRTIDVFNIHPTAGREDEELPAILGLVHSIAPPPYAGSMALYPPILSGDFNVFADDLNNHFPGFAKAESAPEDVIAVAMGLPDRFPSKMKARVARTMILPDRAWGTNCADPKFLFSDHCGVFVRFDADEPDAAALRGVFIDGPQQVRSGTAYTLRATASGGSANLSFKWSPGAGVGSQLDATAGAGGTDQTWTVTVTDPTNGVSRTTSHTVHATAAPNPPSCRALCAQARDECMSHVGEPGEPTPRQCVQALQACLADCP